MNHPITTTGALPAPVDDPFVSRVGETVLDGYAPRTLATLRAGWRAWCAACARHGADPLPVRIDVLLAELARRIEAGHRRATIETLLLYPLRTACARTGHPDPTASTAFRDAWRKLCREHLVARQGQAEPLTHDRLEAIWAVLDPERARDALLGALCGVAYDAMLRISELVRIERHHLSQREDGAATLLVPRSKTDQQGAGATLYLRPSTMAWVRQHTAHVAPTNPRGPWLFPSPYGGGVRPLSIRHARELIRVAGRRIGVEGLSGHSGRVGAAQDMVVAGASLPLVQRMGRWKSVRQPARYAEDADAARSGEERFELLRRKP